MRPSGYEPDELPGCSTSRSRSRESNSLLSAYDAGAFHNARSALVKLPMEKTLLEVVGYDESRDVSYERNFRGEIINVELGDIKSKLTLKTPSDKTFSVQVPTELIDELFGRT